MLFEWTDEKIEWYARASRVTGFHAALAELVRPALRRTDRIADFGCGPGLIDLQLAPAVSEITGIDIDLTALHHFDRAISESGFTNIHTAQSDLTLPPVHMAGRAFDIALFCYFIGTEELFEAAMKQASRLAVLIVRGSGASGKPGKIGGGAHPVCATEMEGWLTERNIAYEKLEESLEFGQPLCSLEEAKRFFETYADAGAETAAQREERVHRQLALVEDTPDAEYPYYFPNRKAVAIFFCSK